jgi:3-deoxy-manno-octulosonate cytidylyltransferase (CMP-KDO synthetase)
LIKVDGKSIVHHVYDRVTESALFDEVIIATDTKKLYNNCIRFCNKVVMTDRKHVSGTDRIAEVARRIKTDIVVNVQGDEPLIDRNHLRSIISLVTKSEVEIATLCSTFEGEKALKDPSNVKVVKDINKRALYFSRSTIPYPRADVLADSYHHHIGLYAFKRRTLLKVSRLKPSKLEILEGLEQLRWLENGYDIHVANVEHRTISIDTPQDLKDFKKRLKKGAIKGKRK